MTQPALLVFGGVVALARLPYLTRACSERDMVILAIDEPTPMANRVADRLATDATWRPEVVDFVIAPGSAPLYMSKIAEWQRTYRIVGSICAVDSLVPVYGVICDWLGLPYPGLRGTTVCRDKALQRRYLADFGPRSLLLGRPDSGIGFDEELTWPAVLKPTSRSSSSGVVKVHSRGQVVQEIEAGDYGPDEELLLEELVEGQQFSIESLSQGGVMLFASVTATETITSKGNYFVELVHTYPAQIAPSLTQRLLDNHEALLKTLAFEDGITHTEYRLDLDGVPQLMEVAARAPGDGHVAAYTLGTGTPLEEALVGIACGEPVRYGPMRRVVRQVYLEHSPGVLQSIDYRPDCSEWPSVVWSMPENVTYPELVPAPPGEDGRVHMVLALRRIGDTLVDIHESQHRAASVVFDGRTGAEVDALEARVRESVHVVTAP